MPAIRCPGRPATSLECELRASGEIAGSFATPVTRRSGTGRAPPSPRAPGARHRRPGNIEDELLASGLRLPVRPADPLGEIGEHAGRRLKKETLPLARRRGSNRPATMTAVRSSRAGDHGPLAGSITSRIGAAAPTVVSSSTTASHPPPARGRPSRCRGRAEHRRPQPVGRGQPGAPAPPRLRSARPQPWVPEAIRARGRALSGLACEHTTWGPGDIPAVVNVAAAPARSGLLVDVGAVLATESR